MDRYVRCLILLLLAVGGGCGRDVARRDAREASDPMMRRAAAKAAEGDVDYAIDLYRKALDLEPRMARASLNLAILLHDAKRDYVRALYHYQRYIELRPDTEKRALIENRMRLARQSFVAELSPQAADTAVQRELADLRKAHANLQERFKAVQRELADVRRDERRVQPEPASPLSHTVRTGENLTHIARQYGVSVTDLVRINKLKDANAIVVGQVLTVPAR